MMGKYAWAWAPTSQTVRVVGEAHYLANSLHEAAAECEARAAVERVEREAGEHSRR